MMAIRTLSTLVVCFRFLATWTASTAVSCNAPCAQTGRPSHDSRTLQLGSSSNPAAVSIHAGSEASGVHCNYMEKGGERMIVLTTPTQIQLAQLAALSGALHLEV